LAAWTVRWLQQLTGHSESLHETRGGSLYGVISDQTTLSIIGQHPAHRRFAERITGNHPARPQPPSQAQIIPFGINSGREGNGQITAHNGGSARVLPGQSPSLTVTNPAGPAWMPWDDSWDERRPHPCAMCAFRASACGVRAGRTPGAAEQPSFNPWVQGSSPWRPTCETWLVDLRAWDGGFAPRNSAHLARG